MSDSLVPQSPHDELQFLTAEPAAAGGAGTGQKCVVCQQPISATYYALHDKILCPTCRELVAAPPAGSRLLRLAKATAFGLAAGLLGSILWFAVRRICQLEIGLIAILVGFMVGKAVRKGSGERGGRGYQLLAVVLTYCCITANYMPDVFAGLLEAVKKAENRGQPAAAGPQAVGLAADKAGQQDPAAADKADPQDADPAPAAAAPGAKQQPAGIGEFLWAVTVLVAIVFAVSLAAPFLAGAQNVIGLLIIGFALWEAWKFNARQELPISGPYQLGPGPQPGLAGNA